MSHPKQFINQEHLQISPGPLNCISVWATILKTTADLTNVQKTVINTLHKEGKLLKVTSNQAGCSQSAVESVYLFVIGCSLNFSLC